MKKYLDVNQFLEAFPHIERSTLYKLTSAKKIPHIKLGSKLLFDETEIEAWLEKRKVGG